jgi:Putative esterase
MRLLFVVLFLIRCVAAAPRFEVSLSPNARNTPVDGRLILVIAARPNPEPRFQVGYDVGTAQIFGVDADGWRPGATLRVDETVLGHPLCSLRDLPPGKYYVQAVLHVYEAFRRADGHVLKLPMDRGEGQHWRHAPGNLLSEPKQVEISADSSISLEMTRAIPPIQPPPDTKYIRHLRMQSKLLTEFWGRPMHLGAIVLVPPGFDENPSRRYPVVYQQGHFPSGFRSFLDEPPPADARGSGPRSADAAYRFYQEWSSGRLPKMLIVLTQHPTPYYDDSYGVNTANMGPYGDALTKEFYPYLEKQFRAIGESWARVLYGGSTGGWMTLAQQIFYPDFFGGTWSFCPDPVDFHAFQLVDVYQDKNAYFDSGPFGKIDKPVGRLPSGQLLATMEGFSRQEQVLGLKGRSGGQMDAFHAVFGPAGRDGYPAPLWNPATGQIDPEVARYWQEHYDLTAILKREWERLGPKLIGKIHITMGTKDTFYLDNAVVLLERYLETTKLPGKGPYYGGSIEYGNNEPHCWMGRIPAGQTVEQYYLPIFAAHMRQLAPSGADVDSWR